MTKHELILTIEEFIYKKGIYGYFSKVGSRNLATEIVNFVKNKKKQLLRIKKAT